MSMLKNMFRSLLEARQRQANVRIAQLIQRSEFKYETPEYVLSMLNAGILDGRLGQK